MPHRLIDFDVLGFVGDVQPRGDIAFVRFEAPGEQSERHSDSTAGGSATVATLAMYVAVWIQQA